MTNAPRLRKPKKLGLSVESWLKHEVRSTACTAKVCLYFLDALCEDAFLEASTGLDARGTVVGTSWLVVIAVSMAEAVVAMLAMVVWQI